MADIWELWEDTMATVQKSMGVGSDLQRQALQRIMNTLIRVLYFIYLQPYNLPWPTH